VSPTMAFARIVSCTAVVTSTDQEDRRKGRQRFGYPRYHAFDLVAASTTAHIQTNRSADSPRA
jgi:hypothetical protein